MTAMNYYVSQGWKPHQAAGIVGNLVHEGNLDPGKPQDNGGKGFGIA